MGHGTSWAWPVAAVLGALILLAPFLVVDVPAVLDYPNHLARFFILAHTADPVLSRIYAPHWAPLPNLGMDLIGQALLRVMPPHVAGRLLLAASLLAPPVGAALYARATFRRWTWWSLGACAVAYNAVFILGFLNFLLGVGVAFAGAAAWRILRRETPWPATALASALMGLAAYFCHLLGFAFFALLVASQEAEEVLALRHDAGLLLRRAASSAGRLVAALGPTLALYVATHHQSPNNDALYWLWRAKLYEWASPFVAYDPELTLVSAVLVLVVVVLVWRRAERASGLILGLAALAILFVATPFAAAGGSFLETRLPVMTAFWLFAGLAPRASRAEGLAIAAVLAATTVGRAADVAWNWRGRAQDLAELRTELALVQPGQKILLAETEPRGLVRGRGRTLQGYARLDTHLPALAVIERHAFWPRLFADPSQQTVLVRSPYDRLAEPLGAPPPWSDLTPQATVEALRNYPFLARWRDGFDYVLVLGPPPPTASTPRGLSLLRRGLECSLYRIAR